MATREWSQAEREKAAEQICIGGKFPGRAIFRRHPKLGYEVAIALQCEVNFLRAQIEEARELLTKAKDYTYCDIDCGCPGVTLTNTIGAWLDRNPETK